MTEHWPEHGPYDKTIARLAAKAQFATSGFTQLPPTTEADALIALQRLGYDISTLGSDPLEATARLKDKTLQQKIPFERRNEFRAYLDEVAGLSKKTVWPADKSLPVLSEMDPKASHLARAGAPMAAALEYRAHIVADHLGVSHTDAAALEDRLHEAKQTLKVHQLDTARAGK